MKLSQLLCGITHYSIIGDSDVTIKNIVTDSRKIHSGDLFVALPGVYTDGHAHIEQAIQNGAAGIVVQDAPPLMERTAIPVIITANPRQILAHISAQFHGNPAQHLRMIGVTGTNGKTTTTYMIQSIFNTMGISCGVIGTVGSRFDDKMIPTGATTPEPPELHRLLAQMVSGGVKSVAMEVSSHALAWHRVEPIRFDAAIFTNLTLDHLDFHGSMDKYLQAKQRLFQMLTRSEDGMSTGIAVLNGDDPSSTAMAQGIHSQCKILRFGIEHSTDVYATNLSLTPDGNAFDLISPWGRFRAFVPIPGRYNIMNALSAFTTICGLGYPADQSAAALSSIRSVPGRMEKIDHGQPFMIVVDYAHTPDALEHLLMTLKPLTAGRLISIFGCGGDRDHVKRPIMGRIAANYSDLTIITSDNPRTEDPIHIIDDILGGLNAVSNYKVVPDRQIAIQKAITIANPGDTVVIAGKGHEDYQIIGREKFPFDDRIVAKNVLRQRGYEG